MLVAVAAVHLEQIARKEGGLFAAGAGADFEEEGLDGFVLGRDELILQRLEQGVGFGLGVGEFGLGELGHLAVILVGGELPELFDGGEGLLVFLVFFDDRGELAGLARDGDEALGVGQNLRVVELLLERAVALLDLVELAKQGSDKRIVGGGLWHGGCEKTTTGKDSGVRGDARGRS